jgi:small subunit ribosomal protein S2
MQQPRRYNNYRPRQDKTDQPPKEIARPVSVTLQSLLESGGHFGTKKSKWNPKTKKFIYGVRSGVYIINLEKTLELWQDAKDAIRNNVLSGGNVLFVGTKRQIKDLIKEEATLCGCPFVNERWLGGILTNFEMVKKSVARLEKLEKVIVKEEEEQTLTKKELGLLRLEVEKLTKKFGGLRNLKTVPTMVFIVDTVKEDIAVLEARKMHIPIVSILDTDCNPDLINFPIPSNDDAFSTSALFIKAICDVVLEAKQLKENTLPSESFISGEEGIPSETPSEVQVEKAHIRRRSHHRPRKQTTNQS